MVQQISPSAGRRLPIYRLGWRSRRRVRDLLVRANLAPYRPLVWSAGSWSEAFSGGGHRNWEDVTELGRYSLLAGYLRYIGGAEQVLDLGCGAGALLPCLDPRSFHRYLGVDPTPEAIALATARSTDRATFVTADPLVADIPSGDVVICNEMLYMVPDHRALIDRIGAVLLQPGGHLIVSIWGHPGDRVIWWELDRRFERIDRVTVRDQAHRGAPWGWSVALYRHGAVLPDPRAIAAGPDGDPRE
jgi:SAM-dependent methyltransferase